MSLFEPLEKRVLLSRVFAPELLADPEAGVHEGSLPSAILDTGEVLYFTREYDFGNPSKFVIDTLWRAAEPGQKHVPQTFGDHYFYGGSIGPSGRLALSGNFRVDADDAGMTGVGLFMPHQSDPYLLLYADEARPSAIVARDDEFDLAHGREKPGGGGDILVTILIDDNYEVDTGSIAKGAVYLKWSDQTYQASSVSLDPTVNPRGQLATFRFSIAAPEPGKSRSYTIHLAGDIIKDKAGNAAEERSLGGIYESVTTQGVWTGSTWVEPETPEQLQIRWSTAPFRGSFGSFGFVGKPLVSADGRVAMIGREPYESGTTGDPILIWFGAGGYETTNLASLPMVNAIAMSDGGAVLLHAGDGRLYLAPGPGETTELVFDPVSHGLDGQTVQSPALSRDGLALAFIAKPVTAPSAIEPGYGIYALAHTAGAWTFGVLSSPPGDGVLADDERLLDLDMDFSFTPDQPEDTTYLPPSVPTRLAIHSTIEDDGRFRVYHGIDGGYFGSGTILDGGIGSISTFAGPGELFPGIAEVVLRQGEDRHGQTGLMHGADAAPSARMLIGGEWGLGLADLAVNADGALGTLITDIQHHFAVRVLDLGLRPVLILPGIFGTMPATGLGEGDLQEWMRRRGFEPDRLVIDPIAGVYDDILATLAMPEVGYERYLPGAPSTTATLYAANYDWRMPPIPVHEGISGGDGPWIRTHDGIISGVALHSLGPAPEFHHGIDYLAWWMDLARRNWQAEHPGHDLVSVDVYAHSTGGIITRGYIQSDLYNATPGLPTVNKYISMAVPNRGASKAWNILHNNMAADPAYRAFISKIAWASFKKVEGGETIDGPDGDIDMARLQRAVADFPSLYRDVQEAFIQLYIPTGRALLATYPFIFDAIGNPISASGTDAQNAIALDLNAGMDLPGDSGEGHFLIRNWIYGESDPVGLLAARAATFVFYARTEATFAFAEQRMGPEFKTTTTPWGATIQVPVESIYAMDVYTNAAGEPLPLNSARAPLPGELWWIDRFTRPGQPAPGGDATVPVMSSHDLFFSHPIVHIVEQSEPGNPIDHSEINRLPDSQLDVMRVLGVPSGGFIFNGEPPLAAGTYLAAFAWDPVEAYLEDAQGRRVGWTEATGTLAEIPGVVIFGGADGFAIIPGDIGPLTLHIRGIDDTFAINLSTFDAEGNERSFILAGEIALGEQRTYNVETLLAANDPVAAGVDPDAAISAAAGADGSMSISGTAPDGRPIIFTRASAAGPWIARDPGADFTPGDDLITFIDGGTTHAAIAAADGLWLLTPDASGQWTSRNLTQEIPGAAPVDRELGVMVSPDGTAHLTGLNAQGQLIRYFQTAQGWGFDNLALAYLIPNGDAMPAFAGDLVSFATNWGGLNVIGLDAAGTIWSIWWAPGAARWYANDISTAHSAPPLVGGLTVYLTPWDGINIAGIDTQGHLRAIFWVPEFGAAWEHDDLTEDTGGPLLLPESVTSYTSSWGGLNIAGLDRETDELAIYWWAPDRAAQGWAVEYFTELDPIPSRIVRLRGLATPGLLAPEASLNILATLEDSRLVRLCWMPGENWAWEDVSALAGVRL